LPILPFAGCGLRNAKFFGKRQGANATQWLKLKFPVNLECSQNSFSFIYTIDTVAAFCHWMFAELFSQHKAGINHFNNHPALRLV